MATNVTPAFKHEQQKSATVVGSIRIAVRQDKEHKAKYQVTSDRGFGDVSTFITSKYYLELCLRLLQILCKYYDDSEWHASKSTLAFVTDYADGHTTINTQNGKFWYFSQGKIVHELFQLLRATSKD